MGKVAKVLVNILLAVAAIFLFEHFFPRNEQTAREWIEGEGYKMVKATDTKRRCGRNRQLFRFEAEHENGELVAGQFCFALIRPFSSITTTIKANDPVPSGDSP